MKKLTTVFVFLFFTISLFSQKNVTVKWGPTYKSVVRTPEIHIVGSDKDGFYLLRIKKKYWIERYDNRMNLKFAKELLIPKKGKKKLKYENIFYLKGQLILLVSISNKSTHKSYAFAYPISANGVVGSKFKKLDEISTIGRKKDDFDFVLSKDSTKLLVYHSSPYKKYNNEKFSYKVYDNKLNLLWGKDIQLPYKDKYFTVEDYILGNQGNVYMKAVISPDRSKGEKHTKVTQANKYVILTYKYKTDKISQYEVKIANKWITDIDYDINEDTKEISVGGFYANDFKKQVKGIFYLTINLADGSIKTTSKKEFDKSFMIEMLGKRKAEKGKGLSSFVIDHFLVKKDGGAVLVAEQYYITVHTYTSKNGTYTVTSYHYNNIMVADINNKGAIDWVRKIPKFSADTYGGYYLSYGLSFNKENNHINLFFNDNPKNIELLKTDPTKAKALGNIKKSIVTLVSINEDGNMKRSPLFSAKDLGKIILRPQISLMINDNTVITYGVMGKNYKLGKFTFK